MTYIHPLYILSTVIGLVCGMVISNDFARDPKIQHSISKLTMAVDPNGYNLESLLSEFIHGKTREEAIRKVSQANQQVPDSHIEFYDDEDFTVPDQEDSSRGPHINMKAGYTDDEMPQQLAAVQLSNRAAAKRKSEDTQEKDQDKASRSNDNLVREFKDNAASVAVATTQDYEETENSEERDQKPLGSAIDKWSSGERFIQWYTKRAHNGLGKRTFDDSLDETASSNGLDKRQHMGMGKRQHMGMGKRPYDDDLSVNYGADNTEKQP